MWVAIAKTGAVALAVVQTVDQVQAPGPDSRAPRSGAGDLGVGAGGEGAGLLVADVHELDVRLMPPQGVDDRVRRVADDAVHLPMPASTIWSIKISATVWAMRCSCVGSGARLAHDREVLGGPHRLVDGLDGVVDDDPGDPLRRGDVDHVDRHGRGDLTEPRDVRQQALGGVRRVGQLGQGSGRRDEQ